MITPVTSGTRKKRTREKERRRTVILRLVSSGGGQDSVYTYPVRQKGRFEGWDDKGDGPKTDGIPTGKTLQRGNVIRKGDSRRVVGVGKGVRTSGTKCNVKNHLRFEVLEVLT